MVTILVGKCNGVKVVVFRVLSLFDKHYNNFYMSTSGKKEWHANNLKGKFKFLAKKIRFDGKFDVYRDVDQQHKPTLPKVFI